MAAQLTKAYNFGADSFEPHWGRNIIGDERCPHWHPASKFSVYPSSQLSVQANFFISPVSTDACKRTALESGSR